MIKTNMDAEQLRDLVVALLDEHKAQDLVVADVRSLTPMTDYMVFASGGTSRQVKALADYLLEAARNAGHKASGVEGLNDSDWVLVDLLDVVVHIMTPAMREFYRLEELWVPTEAQTPC